MTKNFIQRTVAGAVLVALILSVIWSCQFFPYAFLALFGVITVFSTIEFHKLTNREDVSVPYWVASVASVALFVAFFLHLSHISTAAFIVYFLIIFAVMLAELFRQKKNPINNVAYFLLGQFYIALPLACLNGILLNAPEQSPVFLFALFVTIWTNDTFAYLVGSKIGKHAFFKRISPKKSWEGFLGGAFGALLVGYLFYRFGSSNLPLWFWLVFVTIVVVFGTLGDLLESLLKRTLGVKDSGNLIPGHGGMLDRFDSLLLSSPFIYLFLLIC